MAGAPPGAAFDVEGMAATGASSSRRTEITAHLHAAIVSGQMRPGIVYSAPALAAQFRVSPTPVREAMIDLVNESLVEVVRNRGFRVVEPSERDLDEIYELRCLLEVPTVAKLAHQTVPAPDLRRLEKLARATIDLAQNRDIVGHVKVDIDFHLSLLALAGNAQLVDFVRLLRSKSRLFGLDSPDKAERLLASSREHLQIVALVRSRNADGARNLMADHIAAFRESWRRESS